jgi:hypothetical protein
MTTRVTPCNEKHTALNAAPRSSLKAWTWVLLMAVVCAPACTQTASKCAGGRRLSLNAVLGLLKINTDDEEITVRRIESCQVSFDLDVTALDRWAAAGATDNVLDGLNRASASRLTLEQAKAEVAALEARAEGPEKQNADERDAALARLDAEFQSKRDAAANTSPRGQFESTAEYNERKRKNDAALAQLNASYQNERAQVISQYDEKAAKRDLPYRNRIEFLKESSYPDPRVPIYRSYDADERKLVATIGGDEYLFEGVPGKVAETLYNNWGKVVLAEPFTEDKFQSRGLNLASASISIIGRSSKAIEVEWSEKTLNDAKICIDRGDYACAERNYQAVQIKDPQNEIAENGLAAIRQHAADVRSAQARQGAFQQRLQLAGLWLDPRTQLIWTGKDNGFPIDLKGGVGYCQALRAGGFEDWRIASIEELRAIYDPRTTRNTPPSQRTITLPINGGRYGTIPAGSYAQYHAAGGILLTSELIWSGTPYTQDPRRIGVGWNFTQGAQFTEDPRQKLVYRVLCVRRQSPGSDLEGPSDAALSLQEEAVPSRTVPSPASPSESGPGTAFPGAASEQSASGGLSVSCAAESSLRSPASRLPLRLQFTNTTRSVRKVFWLSYSGQRVLYSTLQPGASYLQSTFVSHICLIADAGGSCVEVFRPGGGESRVTIDK